MWDTQWVNATYPHTTPTISFTGVREFEASGLNFVHGSGSTHLYTNQVRGISDRFTNRNTKTNLLEFLPNLNDPCPLPCTLTGLKNLLKIFESQKIYLEVMGLNPPTTPSTTQKVTQTPTWLLKLLTPHPVPPFAVENSSISLVIGLGSHQNVLGGCRRVLKNLPLLTNPPNNHSIVLNPPQPNPLFVDGLFYNFLKFPLGPTN